ncbi:MAG: hypothetical protein Q9208_001338 [Pyrenodesmia sp. 3 TL-2023]
MPLQGASVSSSRPLHNHFRQNIFPNRVVVASAGDDFQRLRGLYHRILQKAKVPSFQKYQEQESLVLLASLLNTPSAFLFEIERFAVNVILRAIYDNKFEDHDDATIKEIYSVWEQMYLCFKYVWSGNRMLRSHLMQGMELVNRRYGTTNLQNHKVEGLDEEAILNILAMLLGAGSDTTSAALQTFFKIMALHPDAVTTVQAELDAVVGSERLPSWEDWKDLPHLRALIMEVHRWAPIAIIGDYHAGFGLLQSLLTVLP